MPPVYYADQACERAKLHVREAEDGSHILGQVHKDLTWNMVRSSSRHDSRTADARPRQYWQ